MKSIVPAQGLNRKQSRTSVKQIQKSNSTLLDEDDSSIGFENTGSQCAILDLEQVNCFILDSLCNRQFVYRLIETKRKYENFNTYEEDTVGNIIARKELGGLKIKDKYEKLPEAVRQEMKSQIPHIQQSLGIIEKQSHRWPELQGVYQRLYNDAQAKEERMENLKDQMGNLVQDELMKKILLHKNKNPAYFFKNPLFLNGFLDEIQTFITSGLSQIDEYAKSLQTDLMLEGQANQFLLSNKK